MDFFNSYKAPIFLLWNNNGYNLPLYPITESILWDFLNVPTKYIHVFFLMKYFKLYFWWNWCFTLLLIMSGTNVNQELYLWFFSPTTSEKWHNFFFWLWIFIGWKLLCHWSKHTVFVIFTLTIIFRCFLAIFNSFLKISGSKINRNLFPVIRCWI